VSLRDVCLFAAGALRGHRLRAGLSLLGVAIGVASVILLTALGEGARIYVRGEFLSLGSNLLVVNPGKNETTGGMPMVGLRAPRELTPEDADAIARRVRQVKAVAPLVMGQANARVDDRNRTVNVGGTTASYREVRSLHLRSGRYLPADESRRGERVAVVGSKLQAELFLGENPIGRSLRLGPDRYRVIGVLTPRGVSLGMDLDEIVHIPVDPAMRMFNLSGITQIMVEVRAHEEIEAARAGIVSLLKERHDGYEDVTIVTQDAVLASFGNILTVLTAALGGIAAISLSVAGIGIMNVMLVSVSERTREIGLMKAVGVTRAQVLAVFLVEAAILSTAGGALGVAVGLSGVHALGALYPSFPVSPPEGAVLGASVVSVAVGLVFGALPARRAAALDPVQALAPR
jgi:putative ABC transport system permease protein